MRLLRSEPFDIEAFDTALDSQFNRGQGVMSAARTALLDRVREMDAPDRVRYADRLEEVLAKGPKRRPRDTRP